MRVIAFVAAGWLVACSAKDPKRPGALGGCVSTVDMACPNPATGGGGTPGIPDSSAGGDASSSNTTGCGTADSLVVTMNLMCRPCIIMSCCGADEACSGTCSSLLQCTQGCAQGDQTCLGACENTWPTGFAAYRDFAMCLSAMCMQPCPTLGQ